MTRDIARHVDECRVCGHPELLDVLSLGPAPLANSFLDGMPTRQAGQDRYPLDVAVCPGCWLLSLRHVVAPEILFRHYLYVSSDSTSITAHMRELARGCVRRLGMVPGDLVVELGSNIGTQLEIFRDAGMRVLGVDPAGNLARVAAERGIATVPEFFGAELARGIGHTAGRARLILGRHVFAHVDDLADLIEGVRTLLTPDGLFVIEVPYVLDLLDGNQFDTIYHEHLSYFSVSTLTTLFARHGFRVVDVERAAVHGGSIVVFATPERAGVRTGSRVNSLLGMEMRAGLTGMRRYREFAAGAERVIDAIGGLVRELTASGERVAGYGAPAKGTMLLNACGLGRADVLFCSDNTRLKQGKVLPGTYVPVWSPTQARRHPPDYYLLLAWNYADEIVAREQDFLARGGRFIVPIPEPLIVSAESTMSVVG